MREESAKLLEEISNDFHGPLKRERKRPKKINHAILIEALGEGKSRPEALALAGGTAKNKKNAGITVAKIMKIHPEYRTVVQELLQEKTVQTLKAMTKQKAEEASYGQLAMAAGILADKAELLGGRATARLGSDVDFAAQLQAGTIDKHKLLKFIQERVGTRDQKQLPPGQSFNPLAK